jgi:hypothetical protein
MGPGPVTLRSCGEPTIDCRPAAPAVMSCAEMCPLPPSPEVIPSAPT